jgi:DNA-binding NarL/FixJ family response regulator
MTAREGKPIRVLIVDDHRMFADSLARLLADEEDIDVVGVASSGKEAVELALRADPTVALVDYQMPDRDGLATTTDIKALMPDVMVVMLTGVAEDRLLLAAIDVGCSGFVTKDRAAAEVAHAVRAAAAGEALISPVLLARLLPMMRTGYHAVGSDLTSRETAILQLVAQAHTNQAIATELHLSVNTVRNYMQGILTKLGAHSKLEAVSIGVREGVVTF